MKAQSHQGTQRKFIMPLKLIIYFFL